MTRLFLSVKIKYNSGMPELPEVENLRLGLEKRIVGQKIKRVVVSAPKLVSGAGNIRVSSRAKAAEFVKGLEGETIMTVERRAKNLIFRMKSGKILLVHLKMSGQFVYKENPRVILSEAKNLRRNEILRRAQDDKTVEGGHPIKLSRSELPNKHTHIIFELSSGTLFYNDIRTFGYLLYFKNQTEFDKQEHFKNIGPEPLSKEFTLEHFENSLKMKNSKLKTVLLGQSVVAGLGNIYADEVCFEAGVRPTRRASSLKEEEVKKLYVAIKRILERAIKVGGSSVATYMLLDESRGNYAREHKVYGKGGESCVNCGKKLKSITAAGRTTVFCVNCQK